MFADALDSSDLIVGANIAYDMGVFLACRPDLIGKIWAKYAREEVFDIAIAATVNACAEGRMTDEGILRKPDNRLIDRYSLRDIVFERLGRDDAKKHDAWRLRYGELDNLPTEAWPEEARQYPVDDALNTWLAADSQINGKSWNLHTVPFQSHVALCLHLGSMWGIRCDAASVEEYAKEMTTRQAELKERFLKAGFYRWEGTKKEPKRKLVQTKKAIQERVAKAYDGNPPLTEKGGISTDRMALEDSHDPELEALAEMSKIDKQVSYLPALREAAKVPLNVQSNVFLSTGRTSYKGIIQLIPRKGKLRQCFTARPGKVFISVDYSAIELSTLSQVLLWLGFDSKLAEAINNKLDPHSILGAKLALVEYDDFVKRKKEPTFAGFRQAAKAANFGFPGLMGAAKFVFAKRREGDRVCEWFHRDGKCARENVFHWKGRALGRPTCRRCIEEAEKLRHFYAYEAWAEMPLYWQWVQSQLASCDQMEQFVSKIIRGGLHAPAACNNLFQGLAAFGAKKAVLKMTEEMYLDTSSPLYGSRLVVFAHDETIIEAPEELCHEAGHRQAQVMVEEMRKVVPDVLVSAEPAAMTRWWKEAEPVYENGRLTPWHPKPQSP